MGDLLGIPTVHTLEVGWSDVAWTVIQKRIRQENNLKGRSFGPLKLLWMTLDELPCLLADMNTAIQTLGFTEEDKAHIDKFQVSKEMHTRYTTKLLLPSGNLERYLRYFWRKDVIKMINTYCLGGDSITH